MSRYAPCANCGSACEVGTKCRNCSPRGGAGALLLATVIGLSVAGYAAWRTGASSQLVSALTPPAPTEQANPDQPAATPAATPTEISPQSAPPSVSEVNYGTPYGQVTVARGATGEKMAETPAEAQPAAPPPAVPSIVTTTGSPVARPTAAVKPLAESMASPTALGIEAKEIGTGSASETTWQTDYGSESRNFYRTKGVQLTVTNVSSSAAKDVQAMACWFARRLNNKTLYVCHAERVNFDVGGAATVQRQFYCPILFSNVTKYVLINRTTVQGSKFAGWAVLLMRGNEVVAGRGSGDEINTMIRQVKPLEAVLAAYTPDGRTATMEMPNWRHDPIRTQHGVTPYSTSN